MNNPKRGEIWLVELDPTRGQEIKKTRPAVVISSDFFSSIGNVLQVRSISNERFVRRLGLVSESIFKELLAVLIICVDYNVEP